MSRVICLLLIFVYNFNIALTKNPSVIIVGAGPSGIAAATKLLENSVTNITILEAEDRIGGRIHSVEFGSGYVDLGAEYCHGEKGNIVYELAYNLGLLEHSEPFAPEHDKMYDSKGAIVDSELASEFQIALDTYDEDVKRIGNGSLGDAFLVNYNVTVLKKYSNDNEKLEVATDAIKMLQDLIVMHEGSYTWQQPAAGRHYTASEGDQALTWKRKGYSNILEILMKSYPNPEQKLPIDDKIILNKRVDKIIWNNDHAEVKCSDNSSFIADQVIVTPSIGVLNKNKDTLFEPSLPVEKLNAIEALGFNGIMKIIIHYPHQWWKDDDNSFLFLWRKADLLKINSEFSDGPSRDGISWVSQISAIVKVASNTNVFIVWVSGEIIPEIEKASEDVVLRGCNFVIKKFLGKDYNVTDADKMLRSQWNTNPNFLGTYSYEKVGYFKKDFSYQAQLAEPLVDSKGNTRVLFAGEATHPTLYSTVHGAISTGIREARRIVLNK